MQLINAEAGTQNTCYFISCLSLYLPVSSFNYFSLSFHSRLSVWNENREVKQEEPGIETGIKKHKRLIASLGEREESREKLSPLFLNSVFIFFTPTNHESTITGCLGVHMNSRKRNIWIVASHCYDSYFFPPHLYPLHHSSSLFTIRPLVSHLWWFSHLTSRSQEVSTFLKKAGRVWKEKAMSQSVFPV